MCALLCVHAIRRPSTSKRPRCSVHAHHSKVRAKEVLLLERAPFSRQFVEEWDREGYRLIRIDVDTDRLIRIASTVDTDRLIRITSTHPYRAIANETNKPRGDKKKCVRDASWYRTQQLYNRQVEKYSVLNVTFCTQRGIPRPLAVFKR